MQDVLYTKCELFTTFYAGISIITHPIAMPLEIVNYTCGTVHTNLHLSRL